MTDTEPKSGTFPTREGVQKVIDDLKQKLQKDSETRQISKGGTSPHFPAHPKPDEQVGDKGAIL